MTTSAIEKRESAVTQSSLRERVGSTMEALSMIGRPVPSFS